MNWLFSHASHDAGKLRAWAANASCSADLIRGGSDSGEPVDLGAEQRRIANDPSVVAGNVVYWLEHDAAPRVLAEAVVAVILAEHGLNHADNDAPRRDPMLGPVLGALEGVLQREQLGSLRGFIGDEDHRRAIELEARAWRLGLSYMRRP